MGLGCLGKAVTQDGACAHRERQAAGFAVLTKAEVHMVQVSRVSADRTLEAEERREPSQCGISGVRKFLENTRKQA